MYSPSLSHTHPHSLLRARALSLCHTRIVHRARCENTQTVLSLSAALPTTPAGVRVCCVRIRLVCVSFVQVSSMKSKVLGVSSRYCVLQYVAVFCGVLQSVFQCAVVCCSVLQSVFQCMSQYVAMYTSMDLETV